jgi:hypothetical protein
MHQTLVVVVVEVEDKVEGDIVTQAITEVRKECTGIVTEEVTGANSRHIIQGIGFLAIGIEVSGIDLYLTILYHTELLPGEDSFMLGGDPLLTINTRELLHIDPGEILPLSCFCRDGDIETLLLVSGSDLSPFFCAGFGDLTDDKFLRTATLVGLDRLKNGILVVLLTQLFDLRWGGGCVDLRGRRHVPVDEIPFGVLSIDKLTRKAGAEGTGIFKEGFLIQVTLEHIHFTEVLIEVTILDRLEVGGEVFAVVGEPVGDLHGIARRDGGTEEDCYGVVLGRSLNDTDIAVLIPLGDADIMKTVSIHAPETVCVVDRYDPGITLTLGGGGHDALTPADLGEPVEDIYPGEGIDGRFLGGFPGIKWLDIECEDRTTIQGLDSQSVEVYPTLLHSATDITEKLDELGGVLDVDRGVEWSKL